MQICNHHIFLADDIALNGAHLLEEHDLVNVFDTLPDDAFNELFQSGVYLTTIFLVQLFIVLIHVCLLKNIK